MRYTLPMLVALVILLLAAQASAYDMQYRDYVLVIEEYNVQVRLDAENTAHVELQATIRNNIDYPVVPGYLTLIAIGYDYEKIWFFQNPFSGARQVPLNITNFAATVNGELIESSIAYVQEAGLTVVNLEGLWEPITAGEKRTVIATFDVPRAVDGFLFKEGKIPVGHLSKGMNSFSLPVDRQTVTLIAPGPITYADSKAQVSGNTVTWSTFGTMADQPAFYEFEYTVLPAFPRLGFRGYWLFWMIIFIIFILCMFLVLRIGRWKREPKKEQVTATVRARKKKK